uniref:Pentacotripeptide-repeat region of PRORP domain-containing protein n=1 Tax=Alexandrium monilatum TaxID=311494 RepID=A0A7S4UB72_9DINO
MQKMMRRGVLPDVISYNSVINSCARADDVTRASRWLDGLLGAGLRPDAVSYTALIASCSRRGDLQQALGWLEAMAASRLKPDVVSWTALLKACALEWPARQNEAEAILRRMVAEGVEPNKLTMLELSRAVSSDRQDRLRRQLGAPLHPGLRHVRDVV